MSVAPRRRTGALLLAALLATSCSQATRPTPGSGPPSAAGTPSATTRAPATTSATEFEALYRARLASARSRFTEADVHFMVGMIAHHAQAVVMSGFAPTHGANPEVRNLAARIINAQQDEIATMQQWLRDRDQRVPEVHLMGAEMMVHGAEHHMDMPGMLTPEQLQELDEARGQRFDRLFLTYMIEHHRGAVYMVHELFSTDGAGQDEAVFKFASDVQVDQTTEIARMEAMLAALPAGSTRPGHP